MLSEQKIQTKIQKFLEQKGAYIVKVINASKKGIPDLLVCYRGQFIGIEVKKPTTLHTLKDLQEYNLKQIVKAGGHRCVATSTEEVEILLRRIDGILSKM